MILHQSVAFTYVAIYVAGINLQNLLKDKYSYIISLLLFQNIYYQVQAQYVHAYLAISYNMAIASSLLVYS